MSYTRSLEMLAKRIRQLDALQRIMARGEYIAAGLSVSLYVGPRLDNDGEENDADMQDVEVVVQQGGFLRILHDELAESANRWRQSVQKEIDTAAAFLAEHSGDKQ